LLLELLPCKAVIPSSLDVHTSRLTVVASMLHSSWLPANQTWIFVLLIASNNSSVSNPVRLLF
jgi:hypothetical protein